MPTFNSVPRRRTLLFETPRPPKNPKPILSGCGFSAVLSPGKSEAPKNIGRRLADVGYRGAVHAEGCLPGIAALDAQNVWELSRFAIETEGPQGFGFAGLVLDAVREIMRFGDKMDITNYVTVATVANKRLPRRTGIATTGYAPSIRIGVENAVAIGIDIGERTQFALFGAPTKAA